MWLITYQMYELGKAIGRPYTVSSAISPVEFKEDRGEGCVILFAISAAQMCNLRN